MTGAGGHWRQAVAEANSPVALPVALGRRPAHIVQRSEGEAAGMGCPAEAAGVACLACVEEMGRASANSRAADRRR